MIFSGASGQSGVLHLPFPRPGERRALPLRLCGCVRRIRQRSAARALLRHGSTQSANLQPQQDASSDGFGREHSRERLPGRIHRCSAKRQG